MIADTAGARMSFSVGYTENPAWLDEIVKRCDRVREVYFPWPGLSSGRGRTRDTALLERSLARFRDAGIALNLLLNAACYGTDARSPDFFERLGDLIDGIEGLGSVTTTSPLIGRFVRRNFPDIRARASVNMTVIGTRGLNSLEDAFDEYYMARECNRDRKMIERMLKWCEARGKRLCMLANSGCMTYCAAHAFHDTLVAHEHDTKGEQLIYRGACWEQLGNPENRVRALRDVSFIRPEDLHLYLPYFDTVKLATRQTKDPIHVLESYIAGYASGSVFSLLEPDFTGAMYPDVIENRRLDGFGEHVLDCGGDCDNCGYCARRFEEARVNLEGEML
ncbi:MAG: hypothetical protein ACOXZM_06745 [Eubacteriales bacterium]|jgi:hypothetical protein